MAKPTILLAWGDFQGEPVDLNDLCAQFGWVVHSVSSLEQIRECSAHGRVAGVLLDAYRKPNGWKSAAGDIRRELPCVPVVLCSGFHSMIHDWEVEAAGIFSTLLRPLHPGECRQCLGFLNEALRLRAVRRLAAKAGAVVAELRSNEPGESAGIGRFRPEKLA